MSDEDVKNEDSLQNEPETTDVVEETAPEVEPEAEPTYRDRIKDMLGKVERDEEVFEKEPVDAVGELLSTKGVQASIRGIFNDCAGDVCEEPAEVESETAPEETLKESVEEEVEEVKEDEAPDSPKALSPSDFVDVTSKDEAPKLFPQWNKAQQLIRNLGKEEDEGLTFSKRRVMGQDDEPSEITFQLARDKNNEFKPFMKISFDHDDDSTPAELALPYIKNLGIGVNESTIVESDAGNILYVEFDA